MQRIENNVFTATAQDNAMKFVVTQPSWIKKKDNDKNTDGKNTHTMIKTHNDKVI